MQYNRTADGVLHQLSQKNVDTGMGLERTICILEGKKSVYETEVFADILAKIAQLSGHTYGENDKRYPRFPHYCRSCALRHLHHRRPARRNPQQCGSGAMSCAASSAAP